MKYLIFFFVITVAFFNPSNGDDVVENAAVNGLKKAVDFNKDTSDTAEKFIEKIKDTVDNFMDKVRRANIISKAKDIADKINNFANQAVESNKDVVDAILNSLIDAVQEIGDVIDEIIKEAKDDAKRGKLEKISHVGKGQKAKKQGCHGYS